MIAYFHSHSFEVQRMNGKYRVRDGERKEIQKGYHSFVDVQAVRSLKSGISYVIKYITKGHKNPGSVSESGLRKNLSKSTLALCWLFRKQSFAISKDFSDLINTLHNSNRKTVFQMDLHGSAIIERVVWICLGVFSALELGIEDSSWTKRLEPRVVNRISPF